MIVTQVATPAGAFGAVLTAQGLSLLTFPTEPFERCEAWVKREMPTARRSASDPRIQRLSEELTAYFEGSLRAFSIPLDLHGTAFQREVWGALQEIPWGETRSYRDIAERVGRPKGMQAVGQANGANPVPIIVPCHRVIAKDGTLGGYSGGLDLKVKLLGIEQHRFPRSL